MTMDKQKAPTSLNVTLKPLNHFDLIGEHGKLENLKQIGSEWNGMVELRAPNGGTIILAKTDENLKNDSIFEAIFGSSKDEDSQWTVIKISPHLLEKIT